MNTSAVTSITATAAANNGITDPARFRDLVAAEWIKIRGQRSSWFLVAFCVLWDSLAAWYSGGHVTGVTPANAGSINPLIYPFNNTAWSLLAVLAASFGALSVAGEYSSGLIRSTIVAVPTRGRIMAAKAAVVAVCAACVGLACSAAALPIAGSQLAGKLTGLGPTGPGVPKAVVASALLLAISSLIGMAIGALIRHPAGAVTATWSALLFVPALLGSGSINLSAAAERMPVQLWTAISHTQPPSPQPAPLAPTPMAWLLYAAWPTISVAVAVWVVRRRDV
ncbi:hypothetical protein DN069_17695 [Streptacidiphilus pinicola]|uniref:ABC transporter permease n=1 Tax=Streptacidiphilus pinicola TaxID=2219663 RepID=A0A2X0ILY6_9ACTN|nr:ABC transporter permease [Streptacidiphilus pinicola]RAG84321.1 hypothetical protein DN069_17695 [Streptacidiphilus pinicola]